MRLPKTIWRQLQQYWLWTREVEPMLMNLHPDEIQRCISLAEMPHGMGWLKPLTVSATSPSWFVTRQSWNTAAVHGATPYAGVL